MESVGLRRNAWAMTAGVALVAVLADQVSKWLILAVVMQPPRVIELVPVLNLKLGFNTGMSFGLFSNTFASRPMLLVGFSLLITLALLIWAARSPLPMERTGLAMIAGGALGNVIDRWRHGAVTDFLDAHWQGWHWPTFNIADVAISLGCIALILSTFIERAPISQRAQ